jgi:Regulator of chromosome condensation (RCC1) repeat
MTNATNSQPKILLCSFAVFSFAATVACGTGVTARSLADSPDVPNEVEAGLPDGGGATITSDANAGDGTVSTGDATTPSIAIALAAGSEHACVITRERRVKCWGEAAYGALGNNARKLVDEWTPVDVVGLAGPATAIGSGYQFTCALTGSGRVNCWGLNALGQLGNGTTSNSRTPVLVLGLENVTALAVGYNKACAIVASGEVKCWGQVNPVKGAPATLSPATLPVPFEVAAVLANTGSRFFLLGKNGAIVRNVVGLNEQVLGESETHSIAGTIGGLCKLSRTGGVECLGQTPGDGSSDASSFVAPIGLGSGVAAIGGGMFNACAVLATGAVKCWGRGDTVGDGKSVASGPTPEVLRPVDVLGISSAIAVSGGNSFVCALLAGGGVRCWGRNLSGVLGNDSIVPSTTPVAVIGFP